MAHSCLLSGCRHKAATAASTEQLEALESALSSANELFSAGRYQDAQMLYEKAEKLSIEGALPPEDIADRECDVADNLVKLQRLAEADAGYNNAISRIKSAYGGEHPLLLPILVDSLDLKVKQALLSDDQEHWKQALSTLDLLQAISKKSLGQDNKVSEKMLVNEYLIYLKMKEYTKAEKVVQAKIEEAGRASGGRIPTGLLWQIMEVYYHAEQFDKADQYAKECLVGYARDNYEQGIADALHYRGYYAFRRHDYVAARKYTEESIELKKKLLGERNSSTVQSLEMLVSILVASKQYGDALKTYQKLLKISGDEANKRFLVFQIAAMLVYEKRFLEAEVVYWNYAKAVADEELRPQLEKLMSAVGASHFDSPEFHHAEKQVEEYLSALKISAGGSSEASPAARDKAKEKLSSPAYMLGCCFYWQKNYKAAELVLQQGLEWQKKSAGSQTGIKTADSYIDKSYARSILLILARVFEKQHRFQEALEYCDRGSALVSDSESGRQLVLANISGVRGLVYFGQGKVDDAQKELESALQLPDRNQDIMKQEARALVALLVDKGRAQEAAKWRSRFHL